MNKKILFGILIISLFVIGAGCKEQTTTKPQPTTQPTTEQTTEQTIIEQIIEQEKPSQQEQLLLDFISRTDNIKSYFYKDFNTKTSYWVKGDKIKVALFNKVGEKATEQYDTVYLNRADRTAFAQCASRQWCTFSQRQNYRVVSFSQYNPKTPIEIVKELPAKDAQVLEFEEKMIENMQTIAVNYTDSRGNEIKLWLSKNYAFPYETDTMQGEEVISISRFTDVAFNKVSDSDVALPEGLTLVE